VRFQETEEFLNRSGRMADRKHREWRNIFHQFLTIGRLAIVRGGTRFGKDIPPYVSADGENLLSRVNAMESLNRGERGVEAVRQLPISIKITLMLFCLSV
jgi:hypothetical protein